MHTPDIKKMVFSLNSLTDKELKSLQKKILAEQRRRYQANRGNWFATFWESYPRKVGKLAAEKAFFMAARANDPEKIIGAVAAQKKSGHLPTKGKDIRFCPHPSTWLNQGRWEDEISTPRERYTHDF